VANAAAFARAAAEAAPPAWDVWCDGRRPAHDRRSSRARPTLPVWRSAGSSLEVQPDTMA